MLNKIISKNIINLVLFNGVNLLTPLILIPLIITKFSTKIYGEFIFYNSTFILLSFIINSGTTQSGLILVNKFKKNINEVYSSILILKVFIFIFILIIYLIINYFFVGLIPKYTVFYIYIFIYELLLSDWIYYYKNKLNIMAFINSIYKIFPLLCLFFFDKYIIFFSDLLIIFFISSILSGLISISYLHYNNVRYKHNTFFKILGNIKIIYSIFIAFIFGKIRILANKLILGFFVSFELLAVYDIAEKIKNINLLPSQIIVDSNYSTQSKNFDRFLFKKTLLVVLTFTTVLIMSSLIIIKNLEPIKDINNNLLFSILILFAPLLILQSVNYHIQKSLLLAASKIRLLNRVSVISTISFISILLLLITTDNVSVNFLVINNIISALLSTFFYLKHIINENSSYK